mgnify:CR=1 FL=1
MSITEETRREAYYEAEQMAPTRRRIIYGALKKYGPQTADELMDRLGYNDPNCVRPRLTELKQAGLIEAVGRRTSRRTGKSGAVWQVTEIERAAPGGNDTGGRQESGRRKK